MSEAAARDAAEAVARRSYGKLVALLAARTRDVAGAEDALAEAFASALVDWPAQRRAAQARSVAADRGAAQVDRRRPAPAQRRGRRGPPDARWPTRSRRPRATTRELPDERLALMFACAHPGDRPGDARAADPADDPRLRRRRDRLGVPRLAGDDGAAPRAREEEDPRGGHSVPACPSARELAPRLDAVLEAIYAAFAEGWSDPAGTEVRRRNLADEGIWLGRLVASLLPEEPEALGLLALMLYAQARRDARRDAHGDYVPLAEQDPAAWDAALIDEAEALLARASALPRQRALPARGGGAVRARRAPPHRPRRLGRDRAASTTRCSRSRARPWWRSTARSRSPSCAAPPRASPRSTRSPTTPRLADYQPLLGRARRPARAHRRPRRRADAAYERAIGLESDPAVRRFLERRAAGGVK